MSRASFAAIILAAGLSSRLGRFKPLEPLGGLTILERVTALYRSAGITDIHVVTGFRSEEITPLVKKFGAGPILNPKYTDGMFSSVLVGISHLSRTCTGFFIHPVDIPLVRRQTVSALLTAFVQGGGSIYYPTFLEERGHPPMISADHIEKIKCWSGTGGLRGYLDSYESEVVDIPVVDEFVLKDIDTPEDYALISACMTHYEIPTENECLALMYRMPGVTPAVMDHCRAVADLAKQMATALNTCGCRLNIKQIVAASLVHDLAKGLSEHAVAGARYLRETGFSGIAGIVETHMDFIVDTGAPISASEVVFLADKCIQEDRRVDITARFQAKLQNFGSDPDIGRNIQRRMENAQAAKNRFEALTGYSINHW
jgi:molybdenum cofactor cytidylyltransferase